EQKIQVGKSPSQHLPGAATRSHMPVANGFEGKHGRVQMIAQLVGEHTEALVFLAGNFELALLRELRDRSGNRIVEAEVERPEVAARDGRSGIDSELGYGLADVAIVVHDLSDRQSPAEQLVAVTGRALCDLVVVDDVAQRRQP